DRLLREDAVAALKAELLPLATLVTPNLPELETLTDLPAGTEAEQQRAAEALVALGPAVLAKGGHAQGAQVVDLLLADGNIHPFTHPRLHTRPTHAHALPPPPSPPRAPPGPRCPPVAARRPPPGRGGGAAVGGEGSHPLSSGS